MSPQTTSIVGRGAVREVAGRRKRRARLLCALTEGLPTLPGYVFELNGLLGSLPVDLGQVSRVIRTDPSLSAQVLRLSGMTSPGNGQSFLQVSEAVASLGVERLRTLVMTTSLLEYTGKELAVSDVQAFWQHCFLSALLCERMARLTGLVQPEKAYLGGLLHDIGTLSLLVVSGTEEFGGSQLPPEGNGSSMAWERDQFGLDHCEMGRWIGVSWKFPLELIEVLEQHHDPAKATQNPSLVAIVAVADQLCDLRGIGIGGAPPRLSDVGPAQYEEILHRHLPDLQSEDVARVSEGLRADFRTMFQLLEFTPSGTFEGAGSRNSV